MRVVVYAPKAPHYIERFGVESDIARFHRKVWVLIGFKQGGLLELPGAFANHGHAKLIPVEDELHK
jgi:hypothetical protein